MLSPSDVEALDVAWILWVCERVLTIAPSVTLMYVKRWPVRYPKRQYAIELGWGDVRESQMIYHVGGYFQVADSLWRTLRRLHERVEGRAPG